MFPAVELSHKAVGGDFGHHGIDARDGFGVVAGAYAGAAGVLRPGTICERVGGSDDIVVGIERAVVVGDIEAEVVGFERVSAEVLQHDTKELGVFAQIYSGFASSASAEVGEVGVVEPPVVQGREVVVDFGAVAIDARSELRLLQGCVAGCGGLVGAV